MVDDHLPAFNGENPYTKSQSVIIHDTPQQTESMPESYNTHVKTRAFGIDNNHHVTYDSSHFNDRADEGEDDDAVIIQDNHMEANPPPP